MTRKKKPTVQDGISLNAARVALYMVWCVLFLLYVIGFLSLRRREEIGTLDAQEAAWTAGYIFAPVLLAFGTFWFGKNSDWKSSTEERIPTTQVAVLFSFTFLVHLAVLYYFIDYVLLNTFEFDAKPEDSFNSIVSFGFKLLGLLSGLAILPVNFVLKREDVALGQPVQKNAEKS